MTRNQKIHKLANAIRRYRGSTTQKDGKVRWKTPPHKVAAAQVKEWLNRLGMDVDMNLPIIDGFESVQAFNLWLRTL